MLMRITVPGACSLPLPGDKPFASGKCPLGRALEEAVAQFLGHAKLCCNRTAMLEEFHRVAAVLDHSRVLGGDQADDDLPPVGVGRPDRAARILDELA
jgi:hypothetical protein